MLAVSVLALLLPCLASAFAQQGGGQAFAAESLLALSRCSGVRGDACSAFWLQPLHTRSPPAVHSRSCGAGCGPGGVCAGDRGVCDLPAGVGGPHGEQPDPRPCTNGYRDDRRSPVPASHINPVTRRDLDWRAGGWTPSRCPGVCDEASALCFCDGPNFGRVPAAENAPPGSPPIRQGRLLHGNCRRLRTDEAGRQLDWGGGGSGVTYNDIYGAQGWCTVEKPSVVCSCDIDGFDGELCELVTETVCPNQCSGHGHCLRGFCSCLPGWYGLDCARASNASAFAGSPGASSSSSGSASVSSSDAGAATEAAAPQAQLPEHAQFMREHPHLLGLAVDAWALAMGAADPPGAAPAAAPGSGALPVPLPAIYTTPVSLEQAERGAAAAAAAAAGDASAVAREQGTARLPGRQGPANAAAGAGAAPAGAQRRLEPDKGSSQQQQQQLLQADPHRAQVQQHEQQQLLKKQEQQEQQQQQEQEQQQAQAQTPLQRRGRSLQRHFWTGGGSQRAQQTVGPTQEAVTAAVHAWLSGSGTGGGASSSAPSMDGLRDALEAAGVQLHRLGGARDAALLQRMLEAALSQPLPPGKARRPRIFVYDMPSRFVGRLLQYRPSKAACTWRTYSRSNFSLFTTSDSDASWRYPLESHLHELMLQSPHRTLNPEEADFFYAPVYAACFLEAVAGYADAPWWSVHSTSLVKQAVMMHVDALQWVKTAYPYWNASGGADHIWLFAHDEGACWAPTEIATSSIILTSWGRMGEPTTSLGGWATKYGPVMESWTSRWAMNWNNWHASIDDPIGLPATGVIDYLQHIVGHPCYTPGKDLVLPAFKPPTMFHASQLMGGDSRRSRDILLLLRGDMGAGRSPAFSRGLRQQLTELAARHDWRRRHAVWIGTRAELPGDGSVLLSRSRYCLVVPRDGWSGLLEDAVLHGCVPVVLSPSSRPANVSAAGAGSPSLAQPFSALLRLSSGVLRVDPAELPLLPELLEAIPVQEESALRSALATWAHRMAWLSHPWLRQQAASLVEANLAKHPWVKEQLQAQQRARTSALEGMGKARQMAVTTAPAASDASLLPPPAAPAASADAAEGGDGDAAAIAEVAELFRTRVWQPDAPLDDAMTTLLQWLHHKMLHPHRGTKKRVRRQAQPAGAGPAVA